MVLLIKALLIAQELVAMVFKAPVTGVWLVALLGSGTDTIKFQETPTDDL